jgi:hypothetical protein
MLSTKTKTFVERKDARQMVHTKNTRQKGNTLQMKKKHLVKYYTLQSRPCGYRGHTRWNPYAELAFTECHIWQNFVLPLFFFSRAVVQFPAR